MDYNKDFEDSYLQTEQGKIHYKHHQGSGRRMLFIHGFASNIKTWKRFVGYLPDTLDIYLMDLLGHGLSDAPEVEYTIDLHLKMLDELVKDRKLENFYLLGHSYGGWVAGLYAANHNNLAGLIFEDTAGMEEFVVDREHNVPNYKDQLFKDGLMLNPRQQVVKSMVNCIYTNERITKEMVGKLKIPVQIMWGSNDSTVDTKYSGILASYIKGSIVSIVEGGGHTPHYIKPEETSGMLLSFLKK